MWATDNSLCFVQWSSVCHGVDTTTKFCCCTLTVEALWPSEGLGGDGRSLGAWVTLYCLVPKAKIIDGGSIIAE